MAPRIELAVGDITIEAVEAIVNAANTALVPGGGVDGAITRAAGADALAERRRLAAEKGDPPLNTGEALTTIAGDLACRWIIHTAGPVYSGSDRDPELLRACHRSVLREADRIGARSVAFPAISCGAYGYPPELAAPVAISSVLQADTQVELVRFVLFDEAMKDVFLGAFGAIAERGDEAPG
jgi:O-acetyl-ADP-ribose deacetylase (regulator of RNase III)